MRFTRSLLAIALLLPAVARAQSSVDTLNLTGRSTLLFGLGLIGSRDASAGINGAGAHASGELASMSFSHWVTPSVAAEISTGVLGANATAGFGSGAGMNEIMPILFGLSVSPRSLALGTSLRPYLSVAAGPYIHTSTEARGANASASSETVAGARVAAGSNIFVARHFLLAVSGEYHAVGRFSRLDAVTEHPSGFGMTFALGFAWGGR
jgi:hypothetical protein